MSTPAIPDKIALPQNALCRSHIEICRFLQLLVKDHISIAAEFGQGRTFMSHILHIDLRAESFAIAFSANKSLNSEVFESPSIKFTANYQEAHLEFEVANPVEIQLKDQQAIQFPLPDTLIIHHRRESPRVQVTGEASLRCIADEGGFIPFESRITDISLDGLGGILYDQDIRLEPGTLLKGCHIMIPKGRSAIADLELRSITSVTLPDGTPANRAGFRFIQRTEEIMELINFFIQDLDKK